MSVKERPIPFLAPMVMAILAGKKTQTRRIVKFPCWADNSDVTARDSTLSVFAYESGRRGYLHCPYGQPGDRLWVRETWRPYWHPELFCCVNYRADNAYSKPAIADENGRRSFYVLAGNADEHWRPSIFMPRWASRITLEITDVRAERLHEISDEDCRDEGIDGAMDCELRIRYRALWESINGSDSWIDNPWVWVITFESAEVRK